MLVTVNVGHTLYREKMVLNIQFELKRCGRCFCFWKMFRYIIDPTVSFKYITDPGNIILKPFCIPRTIYISEY